MRVDIWCTSGLVDPGRSRSWLWADEVRWMDSLLDLDDQARFATSRVLTRLVTGRREGDPLGSAAPVRTGVGYPPPVRRHPGGRWTSASHTGTTVVVAVGHAPVGVDVETTGQARRVLARRLSGEGARVDDDEAVRRWCAGEALAKCAGLSTWQLLRLRPGLDFAVGQHTLGDILVSLSTAPSNRRRHLAIAWRGRSALRWQAHDADRLLRAAGCG